MLRRLCLLFAHHPQHRNETYMYGEEVGYPNTALKLSESLTTSYKSSLASSSS